MAYITTDRGAWNQRWLDTSLNAICVKERGKSIPELQCGRLSVPCIQKGDVLSPHEFEAEMRKWKGRNVIVIGHGWMDTDEEKFVWQGGVEEFLEQWEVD